ncbi:MAG: AAA family ATPase [Bacteroidaceae bacterium]|nr:AAA family ATPase [Bacteroidaceae bacterium]
MSEATNNEKRNVQQAGCLTGPVNSQALSVADIVREAVNKPTDEELKKSQRLEYLDSLRITTQTEVPPEQPILSVDGVGFFALSDIHALKGKQKQGKSSVLKVMVAALLSGQVFRLKSELQESVVLWCDTEQKPSDVKLIFDEVQHLTGLSDEVLNRRLLVFQLRKLTYETLYTDTYMLVEKYHPQVVILDGVVQFVQSFNDEVTSRKLIHDMMVLAEDFQCSVINVLHENKAPDDENMRGHLGTELSHASGTVLSCTKSVQGNISVKCTDPRHGVVPTWSIRFNLEGHVIDSDAEHRKELEHQRQLRKEANEAMREQERRVRLNIAMDFIREAGGSILRSELAKKMSEALMRDRTTAGRYLTAMIKAGQLFENNRVVTASAQTMLAL